MYARQSGDSEYLQPFGEGGLCLGLRLCRREGGNVGTDARDGRGRRSERCSRERYLPRTGYGTQMSKELGATLAKKMDVNEEEQLPAF